MSIDHARLKTGYIFLFKEDRPFARRKDPGDDIEEGRLPSSVGPHNPEDLSLTDGEGDVGQGGETAKVSAHFTTLQKDPLRRVGRSVKIARKPCHEL